MNEVYTVTAVLLSAAALLTVVRLVRGPSVLDRIVALDVLVTLIVTGIAVRVAAHDVGTSVPLLLVLALLGFIGSITAAHLVEEREDMR
ncbi:monovalent cation/H+ antiporter complex subunit F [Streptomyces litchfieldiae]|uniref:Monovalent cation/H+ antiporter complex subunit F n=1 Tax=Streptomyces litchfieldiae TaxID=3075543 RepID=A0ABU2MLM4_9ACTN|nr:monovalent cation/H+ antiporter complex subunit F [Streptomyces sp. DSM 44938]MDT0342327.1 monovalent cation/H+ antiporter complex subunit F [Streptomyces sp. DSM 44938]